MKSGLKTIGIVYMLVIVVFFGFITFEPGVVSAQTTRYVGGTGGGNYSTIQDAINDSIDGDTVYVYNGTYYENVVVNRTINLIGEHWNNTIIDGVGGAEVIRITSDLVNITGFTITNGFYGVRISSNWNTIVANNISSNFDHGIFAQFSDGNNITNNNISLNGYYSILFYYSNGNIVEGNNISYNDYGIYIVYSRWNNITNNVIIEDGIGLFGDNLEHYNTHNIDILNTVNNKPVYYWKNQTGGIIPPGAGQVILANCTNVIVENQALTHTDSGIQIAYCSNISIIGNVVSNNWLGIDIYFSSNNTITGNDVSDNLWGISLFYSDNNSLKDNTISYNDIGLNLYISINNSIYHNNFIDNVNQSWDNSNNIWNDLYPSGGNYWSDWYFPDMDCDGFVDYPRVIDPGWNQDNLPFTEMNGWLTGWDNKSAYPNYVPNGMPDFDQRQRPWMIMIAGSNGICESIPVVGDDILIDPNPGANGLSIAPGPNHILDTPQMADDMPIFAYCGPTSVANCLWWFDSKFANHLGMPGDGVDDYTLVEDFGVGDDHHRDNVPLLIEDLATRFDTNNVGATNHSNMMAGVNQLLVDKGLDMNYHVFNMSWPDFPYVALEIRNCTDVILFLGFYEDTGNRVWGHIVTSVGVDEGNFKIGISDPIHDITNPAVDFTSHNNAINVSHDIYNATPVMPPIPGIPAQAFMLEDYKSGYVFPMPFTYYAVVEQAVFISALPIQTTVDYINLTTGPAPFGPLLVNEVIDVGEQVQIWASGYNTSTSPHTPIGSVTVSWSQSPSLGSFSTYLGDTTVFTAGYYQGGTTTIMGQNLSITPAVLDTGDITVNPPTVDYIILTDIPNGTEITDMSWNVGDSLWIYASGYNATGLTYVGLVEVNWTATPVLGNFNNAKGNSSMFTCTSPGLTVIKGENVTLGLNDTFQLDQITTPPTIDYIEITSDPNGVNPLNLVNLGVGENITVYASGYNTSSGLFVDLVNVDWTLTPIGALGYIDNLTGTSTTFFANFTAGVLDLNATSPVDPKLTDNFTLFINPPILTIDLIIITDSPNGTELTTVTLPLGDLITVYASGYNSTTGDYIGLVEVEWNGSGGVWVPIIGNSSTFFTGLITGTFTQTAQNLTLNVSDTFEINIQAGPDYIVITDAPDGSPLGNVSLPVGGKVVAYASSYNITSGIYMGLVDVYWNLTPVGALGYIDNVTGTTTTFFANFTSGILDLNGTGVIYPSLADNFTITILPPTVDYIIILTSSNIEIMNQTVPNGFTIRGKAGAFNYTIDYIGDISVNWSVVNVSGANASTTPPSDIFSNFSAGLTTGIAIWIADDGKGHNDTVVFTIVPVTIDYIDITDTPNGTALSGGEVDLGYIEWGYYSMFNYTIGYFGIVNANWTVEGGNSSLLGPTPGEFNGINVGTIRMTVWFNASYFNGTNWFNDTVVYYPTPKVDYIEITDTPGGKPLVGGMVPVNYEQWGFCSLYNNTIGYLGRVKANWTAEGGSSLLLEPTPSNLSGINVGNKAGKIWFNASYGILTDSVQYSLDKPDEPQDLQISAGDSWIKITWNISTPPGSSPIINYTIYRGNISGGEIFLTIIGNVSYFNDTNVINGEIYYYKVSANNSLGEGSLSQELSIKAGSVPSPPTNLEASAGKEYIDLTWSASARNGGLPITNYRIYRGIVSGGEGFWELIENVTTYRDLNVENGTVYYYKVSAVNSYGEGPLSNEASNTTLGPPEAPPGLTAKSGDSYVNLSWDIPFSDGGSAITGYNIYRDSSSEVYASVPATQRWYNDSGVVNDVNYTYKVSAINIIGEGPLSNAVNATPAIPPPPVNKPPKCTISFPSAGATLNGTVVISGNASDPEGNVQRVEVKIGDGNWQNATGTTSWTFTWDTKAYSNGGYIIYARSYDGENYSSEQSVSVVVDNPKRVKEKSVFEEPWFWGLIVLIIIVLLIVFFFIVKKRREAAEEEIEEVIEEEPEEEEEEELEEEELEEEPEEELMEEFEEEEPEEEEAEELEEKPEEKTKEKPAKEAKEEKGEIEVFECPECGATLKPDEFKCPKCGVELED